MKISRCWSADFETTTDENDCRVWAYSLSSIEDPNLPRIYEMYQQKGILNDTLFIVTADHGGHDRTHGTDMPEDMTIPLFIRGKEAEAGKKLEEASILDIAPTVAKLLGVRKPRDWEGKELL